VGKQVFRSFYTNKSQTIPIYTTQYWTITHQLLKTH